MERKPTVSVIVPVYNVEEYLEQCIDSILSQTYKKIDIILVDDGSSDNSSQMCDNYAATDSRIRVFHKENGGLMSAWMAGVGQAIGEYLVFIDSDDWIEPIMIEDLVSCLGVGKKEIICSNYVIEKEKKSIPIKQAMIPGCYNREEIEEIVLPQILGNEVRKIHCSRCMKLISKELIVDNMLYCNPEITMGEDLNIMFPAMLDAERIVILEEGYYYHYRFVDASMVHKYNPKLSEKVRVLYQTLKMIIEKKVEYQKDRSMFYEGLKKEYIVLQFFVLKNELRGPGDKMTPRIQNIIYRTKKEAGLENITLEIRERANRLLFAIWKKPSIFRILMGRMAISIFDRM